MPLLPPRGFVAKVGSHPLAHSTTPLAKPLKFHIDFYLPLLSKMRIATLASVTTYLWAAAMMTVAQPVGDENTDSSPAALKLPRDVAGGWWWDQKPTGTKDRPHKCLHRPCETACKLWAVALSLGISCGKLPFEVFFFLFLRGRICDCGSVWILILDSTSSQYS